MNRKNKNRTIGCLFSILIVILMISSSIPARIDIYGGDGDIIYSDKATERIIFYDTAGNDSVLCFESDTHGTVVMCLNGTTGVVTFHGNVSMLENLTVLNNITATSFFGTEINVTWVNATHISATDIISTWINATTINASGDIFASHFYGNGSGLTYINASNITGTLNLNPFNQWLNTTDNATFYNITATNYFIGDGSLLTGLPSGFNYSNWFNQTLNTTDSPTFAGLTLTGFNGFLKATAGVISTATIQVSDISNIYNTFLNLSGNNSNQNIDIGIYDFTTTGNITAGAFFGDGGNLTNITSGNPFNQWLNTTDNASFTWLDVTNGINASYFSGDGGNLTNLPWSNPFNQVLNTTSDVVFNKVTSTFHGDGGNLTNLSCGNPFNQWLNTTDNATFYNLTLSNNLLTENISVNNISEFTTGYDIRLLDDVNITGTLRAWTTTVIAASPQQFKVCYDGTNLFSITVEPDGDTIFDPSGQSITIASSKNFITGGLGTFGSLDVDTLNFIDNWITDSTGTISFDNEHLITTGDITAGAFFGDGGNLTNITGTGNPFNQWLNTTDNATFYNITATNYFIGDGSLLTGVPPSNMFNQDLNTTDSPTFAGLTLTGFNGFLKATAGVISTATIQVSDISNIYNTFLNLSGNNSNQNIDIGIYDFTTTGNITAGAFFGDGGNLTNITSGNPFNQWLNTTDNASFTWLDVVNGINASYFSGDGGNLTNINASTLTGNLSLENISVNNISEYNSYGIHFLNNITFPYTAQIHGGGLGTDLNLYNLDGTLTLTADTIILASADPLSLGTILNMNDNRITNIGDARTDFDNSGNLEFGDYNGIEFGNTTDAKIFWNNADSSLDISNDVNISGACTADAFHGDGGNLTNVSGLGSAYWNRSGATLYPYYDGDDLQVNGSITADAFFGDGGNLTNITGTGNPFNQWLNTTDNASFTYLDIVNDANITGDLTVDDDIILGDKLEFRPPGANDQGFYYYNDTGVLKAQVLYRGSLIPASDYFGIWNNGAKGMWFFNDLGDLRFYQRSNAATDDMEWYTKNAAGTSTLRMQLDNKVDASYLAFITNAHINLWDNNRIALGNSKDAWIYYDTTDLIIDPDVVGSGIVKVYGDVDISGDLTVTENITGNFFYAEAYNHYHTGVAINFVQDVYYNLSFNASDDLNGFTFDGDCNLTCNKPGLYSVNFQASGDGVNNHEYYLSVGINGVSQNKTEAHKKMTAGGDIVTMTGTGFLRLANNDYVSLMIVDVTGGGAGNYYGSNLNLVRIGD